MASPPSLLQLPLDKPRPAVAGAADVIPRGFGLGKEKLAALQRLAASHGSSTYAVFVALYRWAARAYCFCSAHATEC